MSKKSVSTFTFGDVAENHARMQKIGTLHDKGYSVEQLQALGESLRAVVLSVGAVEAQMVAMEVAV
jgi:hypothetical protein